MYLYLESITFATVTIYEHKLFLVVGKKEHISIDISNTQQLRYFVFYVWKVIEYYLLHRTRHISFTDGDVIFINQRVQRWNIVIR
jgi:hypothetical protein